MEYLKREEETHGNIIIGTPESINKKYEVRSYIHYPLYSKVPCGREVLILDKKSEEHTLTRIIKAVKKAEEPDKDIWNIYGFCGEEAVEKMRKENMNERKYE